jgi:hypothetical protein
MSSKSLYKSLESFKLKHLDACACIETVAQVVSDVNKTNGPRRTVAHEIKTKFEYLSTENRGFKQKLVLECRQRKLGAALFALGAQEPKTEEIKTGLWDESCEYFELMMFIFSSIPDDGEWMLICNGGGYDKFFSYAIDDSVTVQKLCELANQNKLEE